jgi:transcriptional regulator with GAF, ATPase, and Fis domain
MVIVPLCLNNEVLGYILLINEKTPRTFTNDEIDLLKESADYSIAAIKKAISHEEEKLTAKIISEIEGYKTYLDQKGTRKNPAVTVQIFQQSGIKVRRIFLINKDPQLGNRLYHAVINASGATEVNEMGTISESGFDFFYKDLVIKDHRFISVPIKTGDNLKGKLAIKYSQIDNDRVVKDNMVRVLETIAPKLADLMYL